MSVQPSSVISNGLVVFSYFQKWYWSLFIHQNFALKRAYSLFQSETNVHGNRIIIMNCTVHVLKDLCNSCVLDYYGAHSVTNNIQFENCFIITLHANGFTVMLVLFFIYAMHMEYLSVEFYKTVLYNKNNFYVSYTYNSFKTEIWYCSFHHNYITNIIKDIYKLDKQSKRLVNIGIDTVITSNTHNNGDSLISLKYGQLSFESVLALQMTVIMKTRYISHNDFR